jgi:hypothetical protein
VRSPCSVSDGTNSAAYSLLANSSLVGQIVFASNSATRMTTAKHYDFVNVLYAVQVSVLTIDTNSGLMFLMKQP